MSVQLLHSLPATGKTQACVDRIRNTLQENPLAQVRIIVPDQLQAAYFRRRLSSNGGAMGAFIGTFGDLYRSILENSGSYIPVASNALLHRIVQEVIDEVPLAHYNSLRTFPGFIRVLRDAFAELKRALVYPEAFIQLSHTAPVSQQELAQLYSAYQQKLHQLGWADMEGISWLAVEALEGNHSLPNPVIDLLIIDGFDSFIRTQRRTLQLLADRTEIMITLEGEKDSNRSVHSRFNKTFKILAEELAPQIVSISNKPYLKSEVLHTEEHVFEAAEGIVNKPEQAFLIEARSPSDEVREVLRWIKSQVLRDKIPLHTCAVFTPDPDIYQPLFRSVAREFGIPIYCTQDEPLRSSPAMAALTNLLALLTRNFRTNLLFKCLRSPYFSFSFDPQTVVVLENISRITQIVEGPAQWEETWDRLLSIKMDEDFDLDDEREFRALPHGAQAQVLRDQLRVLFAQLTPLDGLHSQNEWVLWLEDLLDGLRFSENMGSLRDELSCEVFREALRALVLSESIVGERRIDFHQFISDLQSTLEASAIHEASPISDCLLVGNLREARGLRFQAVALLGFSEGIFPEVERPDPFLSEGLRSILGLDSRLDRHQISLFYQAITRTDSHIFLTRPYLSNSGEQWEASPFWSAIADLFSEDATQKIRPDDFRSLTDAGSTQEILFWALRDKQLPKSYVELQQRWRDLQLARDVLRSRRVKTAQGKFEGNVADLSPALNQRYAPTQVWSASQLETYGTCPQMFYIRVTLGLEATVQPVLGLDVMQMGSILHKILEETFKTADDPSRVDAVLKNLRPIAESIFERAPQKYGFRPSQLWELEKEQFLSFLKETIEELSKASKEWSPFAYEQAFGSNDLPPLEISLDNESVLFRGVIDRVDKNENGDLRIVDYKTGSSHLTQRDLKEGRRLQLPLYAIAARDALKLGDPVAGLYWAIKAGKTGSLRLEDFKDENDTGVERAIETLKKHVQRILNGIRSGEFSPIPPKDGCPAYCPATQWCWRYKKGGW